MCIDGCQVQIPEGALSEPKHFVIKTSLIENYDKEYAPISAALECNPATDFEAPVQIMLPIWCQGIDGNVQAEVVCVSSNSEKHEVIQTINLQNTENEVIFNCQHFSSFFLRIRKVLFGILRFTTNVNIWKSQEGNFTFVLSVKDRTIERMWKEELTQMGYSTTRAVFTPIKLMNKYEVAITMTSQQGHFQNGGNNGIVPNFLENQIYYKNFVLYNDHPDEQARIDTIITCKVSQQQEHLHEVMWNETTSCTSE